MRDLQKKLGVAEPELTAAVGLIPDGDYGDKTFIVVAVIQVRAILAGYIAEGFVVDGHCGRATRAYFQANILVVDLNEIPFAEGGECMYADPDLSEPLLWKADSEEPENFEVAVAAEEPIKS